MLMLELLHQGVSQIVNAKEKFFFFFLGKILEGNEKCYPSEHINDKKKKKAKQPYCIYGESLGGLHRRSNQAQHSIKPYPGQGLNSLTN